MSVKLNPQNAYIFRIVHRDNIPWLLTNGLHCPNSSVRDPSFVSIGDPDLIDKRTRRAVPISPGGTLPDYVPFYFTPYTPMLLNIKTGYRGVTRRRHHEIVILASSIHRLAKMGLPFVFTDRHAYLNTARFFSDPIHLDKIDWAILQRRDFRRDNDDLGKVERYQAEALVHRTVPVDALGGIICYDDETEAFVNEAIGVRDLNMRAIAIPGWYV